MGRVDTSQLKSLSLAGTSWHTPGNEALWHNGLISLELLSKRNQGFHRADVDGVSRKVLSNDVASQLPHLLSLVQRMGNATLQRAEHELQFMQRLFALLSDPSHASLVVPSSLQGQAFSVGRPMRFAALWRAVSALAVSNVRAPILDWLPWKDGKGCTKRRVFRSLVNPAPVWVLLPAGSYAMARPETADDVPV